jgi:hypothetical protein
VGWPVPGRSVSGYHRDGEANNRELEANVFAEALLMPKAWVNEAVAGEETAVDASVVATQLRRRGAGR